MLKRTDSPAIKQLVVIALIAAMTGLIIFNLFKKGGSAMNTAKETPPYTNHLIDEKSPYLLQHARNPVDWYPWGDKAFEKAIKENKLIFLSIGYSACHWCHVMAHESFENNTIAGYLNEHFVSIKVDREEYPDVDQLYQTFVQMTSGRGGWPLTVFLTPQKVPIYGGTYFPPEPRYGMISFPGLLRKVQDLYKNNPEKIEKNSREIAGALKTLGQVNRADEIPAASEVSAMLLGQLMQAYDKENGGFSAAPKFPHASDLGFLLDYYFYTGRPEARDMALQTLKKMACGGMYDQLGGGFHRYSTDAVWLVPHFEKMLYDNALLIPLYAQAFRLTGEDFYLKIVRETAGFVTREMTAPAGGFYSTLDADSEGKEGQFYTWDFNELQHILGDKLTPAVREYWGISKEGNFEGKNILHRPVSLEDVAARHHMDAELLEKNLQSVRRELFQARGKRIRPSLDTKILADVNGMMISALWSARQVTGDGKYSAAAEKATNYILKTYRDENTHLSHFVKNTDSKIPGYLDDYAYFIQALLDGFETTQKAEYLQSADLLIREAQALFWDKEQGGFFFSTEDAKTPFSRLRQNYDASVPAGNSIMAMNLLRLSIYTGNTSLIEHLETLFKVDAEELNEQPMAMASLVRSLLAYTNGLVEVTLAVPEPDILSSWLKQVFKLFIPNRVLVAAGPAGENALLAQELLENRRVEGKAAAFICYQRSCSLPVFDARGISQVVRDFGLTIR